VNEAVEAAHRDGILQAASLMVAAPAAADAVARARRLPSLRVGLHLTLVDGRPLLPAEVVPQLVDAHGNFPGDPVRAGISIFFSPRARRQLARELAAQFEAFRATGLSLDHVNAHKHFHLHPTVGRAVIDIGAGFGLKAVRVPAEPVELLAAVDGRRIVRPPASRGPWAALLRSRLGRHGLLTSDRCVGETWSGAMTEERLAGVLGRLPAGVTEIYCHPATSDRFDGAVRGFRYAEELAALLSPRVAALARRPQLRLAAFGDLSR
jgi:hopanoid biosynthesis associated protein HpnK